jgi:hypothetical protein
MGVAAGDTTEQALAKIADKFAAMPDGIQKTALAINTFGKSGADLIPLLNAGSKGIAELQTRAKELGIVFDDISAKQAELFNDKLDELNTAARGITTQITIGLLPALSGLTEELAESVRVGTGWQTVGENIGEGMLTIAEATGSAIDSLIALQAKLSTIASVTADLFKGLTGSNKDRAAAALRIRDTIAGGVDEDGINKYFNKIKSVTDGIRARMDQGEFQALGGSGKPSGAGGAGGGGTGATSAFDSWIESLKKSASEMDLIQPKMTYLAEAMAKLNTAGLEGSSGFKVMSEEYQKLNELSAKGNIGAQIEQQVVKIKEEASITAQKMEYLGSAIAKAFETGDVEGAQALLQMMDQLKGKTQETKSEFDQLGEGIKTALENNGNNAINSFIDSIGTAKLSFGDFATAIIKDIAKMVLRLLVLKPLMNSIMGLFPSGGAQVYPVSPYAHGGAFDTGTGLPHGIYNSPQLFKFAHGGAFGSRMGVLGERGSEAILPLKRTSQGDLGVQSSPSVVNVEVNNYSSAEVKTETQTNTDGSQTIKIFIQKEVKEMFAGGGMDRTMRGSYGLSRIGA